MAPHTHTHTHTHTGIHTDSELMRPDEDKCSINKTNSGIISFLRFHRKHYKPAGSFIAWQGLLAWVARLVGGKGGWIPAWKKKTD